MIVVSEFALGYMVELAKEHEGFEVGGFIYNGDGRVPACVLHIANQSDDPMAYVARPEDVREALEYMGRYPDATWHSHVRSTALSGRDPDALRPWASVGVLHHVVVLASGEHEVHTLEAL